MGSGLRDGMTERASETAAPIVETVQSALETSLVRGGAAWHALQGGPVGPPVGVRRWPWAVTAAVLGAAAGAAVAYVVGRLIGQDAPDAQEPEEVQAVVDRAVDLPGAPAEGKPSPA